MNVDSILMYWQKRVLMLRHFIYTQNRHKPTHRKCRNALRVFHLDLFSSIHVNYHGLLNQLYWRKKKKTIKRKSIVEKTINSDYFYSSSFWSCSLQSAIRKSLNHHLFRFRWSILVCHCAFRISAHPLCILVQNKQHLRPKIESITAVLRKVNNEK